VAHRHRERTVLVMWEYTCDHSPIWSRTDDLDTGPIDARDLGLPEALRDDLADWNDRCETAADPEDELPVPVTSREWRDLGAEAFALAARVQRGLGDDWTVWCLAGGGDGGLRDRGAFGLEARTAGVPVLLRTGGPVAWTPVAVKPALDRFDAALVRRERAWRGSADRLPPSAFRADALELAGALHAALPSGRVLWFGGEDVPA
jgi:hypothetical protein